MKRIAMGTHGIAWAGMGVKGIDGASDRFFHVKYCKISTLGGFSQDRPARA
jgi:hypothetical protein